MRLSLRNRLTLLFFGIDCVAIAALYLIVAPGLQTRLLNQTLNELAANARHYSARVGRTVGSSLPLSAVTARVDAVGLASGSRVTLLLVTRGPGGLQLSPVADSSKLGASAPLRFPVAVRAVRSGTPQTGTETARDGTVAEAAEPIRYAGQIAAVIVFSTPVSDIVRSVAVVRHEILFAGGVALVLALLGRD